MGSSVIDVANPQQGGRKGKNKANKVVAGLVNERLEKVHASMSTLMGGVEDMEKCIEELSFVVDTDELRWGMQSVMTSFLLI